VRDPVNTKIKRLLTRGWCTTSEPLDLGEITIETYGCLKLKVKLSGCSPNAPYIIGLNIYGLDLPIFGGLRRLAYNSGTQTVEGASKKMVNAYALGTVTAGPAGGVKFKTILPVTPGVYDIQTWISRGDGAPCEASMTCYQSGEAFGDSDVLGFSDELDRVYTTDYFEWHSQYRDNYRDIAEIVDRKFRPTSVIDVGCGCGWFLEFFHRKGIHVRGIDGSTNAFPYIASSIRDTILIRDITQWLERDAFGKYDLGFCVEVGEEIDPTCSEVLVGNLVHLAARIFFTSAPPGEGGRHHINRQPREFWLEQFAKHGFEIDDKVTEEIKTEVRHNIQNLHCRWIVRNLIVVQKGTPA